MRKKLRMLPAIRWSAGPEWGVRNVGVLTEFAQALAYFRVSYIALFIGHV